MTTFLLHSYIKDFDNAHIKNMQEKLFSLGVLSKDYADENLILLYNKYGNENKAPLELECRSVVINRTDFNIENYSCITPIYNGNAMNYLMMNQDKEKEIFICYEGSLLSLFHFNGVWYFSSRRNLMKVTDTTENPHFKMFCSVIDQDGFNINTFIEKLDTNLTYHFVLIHHQNKNIINYEKSFGKDYKKLCFIFAREKGSNKEINSEDLNCLFLTDNIFLPKKVESIENFDETNTGELTGEPTDEGIIVKINNKVLKLQNIQYQFYKAIGPEKNLYRGFIHLYQNNKLGDYFKNNENTMKYNKIVNPIKTDESFDTMGTIDAVFKVITKELFQLFNTLWDIDTGSHKNKDVYNILSNEYRVMMYNIRKLYFINKKKGNTITFKNVYFYLKSLDVNVFEKFMRSRKLMLNLVRKESKDSAVQDFGKTTNIEKKMLNKLCAIYTSKMFPEIMPDDLPK
jgi:hypothetical protein